MLGALLPWYKHVQAWLDCMFELCIGLNTPTNSNPIHGFMMGIVTYGMKKNNMVMPEMQDPSCEEMFAPYHPSASEPNLTVSLWGQKHSVSVRDISQLTLAQFSSIWTVRSAIILVWFILVSFCLCVAS